MQFDGYEFKLEKFSFFLSGRYTDPSGQMIVEPGASFNDIAKAAVAGLPVTVNMLIPPGCRIEQHFAPITDSIVDEWGGTLEDDLEAVKEIFATRPDDEVIETCPWDDNYDCLFQIPPNAPPNEPGSHVSQSMPYPYYLAQVTKQDAEGNVITSTADIRGWPIYAGVGCVIYIWTIPKPKVRLMFPAPMVALGVLALLALLAAGGGQVVNAEAMAQQRRKRLKRMGADYE